MTTETTDVATEEQVKQEQQEAEAGFAAGFKKIHGEPDKADVASESERSDAERAAQAKSEAEAKAKTEADAKAAVEAAEKAAYEALPKAVRDQLAQVPVLKGAVDKLAGHLGGLANATARIETALKSAKTTTASVGGDAPSDKQVVAALSNPAAWKQLKEDFPDWAGPVEAEFAALRAEMAKAKAPAVDVDGMRRDFKQEIAAAKNEARQLARIDYEFPEWEKTVNTPEFKSYCLEGGPSAEQFAEMKARQEAQPTMATEIENAFASHWARERPQWWAEKGAYMFGNTADHAIPLLTGFSEVHKKAVDAEAARLRREKRLEQATTPRGTQQPVPTSVSDEEAFVRGFKRAQGK